MKTDTPPMFTANLTYPDGEKLTAWIDGGRVWVRYSGGSFTLTPEEARRCAEGFALLCDLLEHEPDESVHQ